MRCRECGAELPGDARFCLSCGTRVVAVSEERAAASVTGRLHVSAADALGILNTPAWKATAWRRSPLSSLLATPATETIVRPAAAAATAVSGEAKTHVSGGVR